MHWMHRPERDRGRDPGSFDPIVEGARHGLSREPSLAIWKRACTDLTSPLGHVDVSGAAQRFHELAARTAVRGTLERDIGRDTLVAAEARRGSGAGDAGSGRGRFHELAARTPGRDTLVAAEARRRSEAGDADGMAGHGGGGAPAVDASSDPGSSAAGRQIGTAAGATTSFGDLGAGVGHHLAKAVEPARKRKPPDAAKHDVPPAPSGNKLEAAVALLGEHAPGAPGDHRPLPPAAPTAATAPRGAGGRIRFRPTDLGKLLPPIGPNETIEQRRNRERAALTAHEAARAHATTALSSFASNSDHQAEGLRSLAPAQDAHLRAGERRALAAVDGAAAQQAAAVRAHVAQAIAQASGAATAARAQIEAQYLLTTAAIEASTSTARIRIDTALGTSLQAIEKEQQGQLTVLGTLYADAATKFKDAGRVAGDYAVSEANHAANEFLSHMIHRDDSLLDGPLTDNRCKARADAAKAVGEAYQKGLAEEADKQIGELNKRRPTDEDTVRAIAGEARTNLDAGHKIYVDGLEAARIEMLASADQTHTSLLAQVDNALSSTIDGLHQAGQAQARSIHQQAGQLKNGIRTQRQAASAQLHHGIESAIAALHHGVETMLGGLDGAEVPETAELDKTLTGAEDQLTKQLVQMRGSLAHGAVHTAQALAQTASHGAQSLHSAGAAAIASIGSTLAAARTSFTQLGTGGVQSLQQIATSYTKFAEDSATAAETGLAQVVTGLYDTYIKLTQSFREGAQKNADAVRDAFKEAVDKDMPPLIQSEAAKAAKQVQPRWKSVVKWIIIIAIVLVVALVIGPMVIGAVAGAAAALGATAGAAAVIGGVVGGALVGAAASAATTIVDNAFSGKPLMEGVAKSAMWGAIGGAVGGAVSAAVGPAIEGLSIAVKVGITVVTDVVVDTALSLFQGNLSFESFVQGLAMSVLTNGVTAHPRVNAVVDGHQASGTAAGKRAGERVRPPKMEADAGAGGAPEISVPKLDPATAPKLDAPKVEAPKTGAKGNAPKTDAPKTDAPKTDAPKTDAPKTDAPKSDAPKSDAPKSDAPKSDAPKSDAPKSDAPKSDAPKSDAPKSDAPKTDAPKTDAPKTDAPKTDAPKTDAPKTDAPKTDAPKTDAPKTDAPKTDAPKTDAPKTDAPKTDAPKTDAPKTDAPKTDAPRSGEGDTAPDRAPDPMSPAADPKKPVGPGGFESDAISLTGKGDKLGEAVKWLKPEPGKIDVVVHGDADGFYVLKDGAYVKLDHRALAKFIKKNGGAGADIRLISCGTGDSPLSIAKHLANKLGAKVTAPSDTVWVHPDGRLTIGKNPAHSTGDWNTFKPGIRPEANATPKRGTAGDRAHPPGTDAAGTPPAHSAADTGAVAAGKDDPVGGATEPTTTEPPRTEPPKSGSSDRDAAAGAGHDRGGIAAPAAVQRFVADIKELQGRWSEMDPPARADALGDIINGRLQEAGVAPTKIEGIDLPKGINGEFNAEKWQIELNNDMLSKPALDADAAQSLASTVAHEAHHAEQYFLAARSVAEPYRAGSGRPDRPDAFLKFMERTRFNPDAARAVFDAPPLSPAEIGPALTMYNQLFGKHRAAVINERTAANAAHQKAKAAWEANNTPESLKARNDAAHRHLDADEAYKELPEEIAAREVGRAVVDQFGAPGGTSSPAEPPDAQKPGPTQ